MQMDEQTRLRIEQGKDVACLQQARYTGAYDLPIYYYNVEFAKTQLAQNREHYPSILWRLTILSGPEKGKVL